jgi:hypothetical protein
VEEALSIEERAEPLRGGAGSTVGGTRAQKEPTLPYKEGVVGERRATWHGAGSAPGCEVEEALSIEEREEPVRGGAGSTVTVPSVKRGASVKIGV